MKKINKTNQSQTPSPLRTPSPLPLKGEGGRHQEEKQYASHSTPSLQGRAGGESFPSTSHSTPSLQGRAGGESFPSTSHSAPSLQGRAGGGSAGGGSAEDGSLLWVPTWEGVLQWCPADLAADRPLRFWRVRKDKKGRMLRYQLAIYLLEFNNPACSKQCFRKRRRLHFTMKGRTIDILCSALTILCRDGFAIADRHHWVVDHINGNTLDDRPSNLQVISQKENLRKSVIVQKLNALRFNIKTHVSQLIRQKLEEQRRRLAGTMHEASRMDVEMELSLWFNERKEKMYEEAIREVTGRKP